MFLKKRCNAFMRVGGRFDWCVKQLSGIDSHQTVIDSGLIQSQVNSAYLCSFGQRNCVQIQAMVCFVICASVGNTNSYINDNKKLSFLKTRWCAQK